MLGGQTWFFVFAVPTVVVGSFVVTRKRLAYQWREELIENKANVYPPVTDAEMMYFRRVSPAPSRSPGRISSETKDVVTMGQTSSQSFSAAENLGWFVSHFEGFEQVYSDVCLSEIKRLAKDLGNSLDPRKLSFLAGSQHTVEPERNGAEANFFNSSLYQQNKIISDHPEDTQMMKAPWGCGDKLQPEKLPLTLRFLSQQVQKVYPGIGRLRHVYVEYSPSGHFYRDPRSPKAFDGHDYVIVPFRRDGKGAVITFSPTLRSKFSTWSEVMRYSWTNRDIDAQIPNMGMLRVYGTARYDWGWGLRSHPAQWSGSSIHCSSRQGTRWPWGGARHCSRASDDSDAAVVVLHYEGPRAKGKKRSLLLHPEQLIFGSAPTVENFELWNDERPTEEYVQKVGVLSFLLTNYLTMFRVS